jgi:hypothetical protein
MTTAASNSRPSSTHDRRESASELKCLLPADRAAAIVEWARGTLPADPYGAGTFGDTYHTRTLYFDTAAFDVFRRQGSYGRAKYRIRRYGTADVAFLERKMRTRRLLSKRRSIVPLDELSELPPGGSGETLARSAPWAGRWFARRLTTRELRPVCEIRYERIARILATPYGLARFTVDQQIAAVPIEGTHFRDAPGVAVAPGKVIVELKFRFVMPGAFKEAIEQFAIEPSRLSKYRLAIMALGLAQEAECSNS